MRAASKISCLVLSGLRARKGNFSPMVVRSIGGGWQWLALGGTRPPGAGADGNGGSIIAASAVAQARQTPASAARPPRGAARRQRVAGPGISRSRRQSPAAPERRAPGATRPGPGRRSARNESLRLAPFYRRASAPDNDLHYPLHRRWGLGSASRRAR